ncbi:phosphonoacetaldehyde reductase [Bacillus ndiopicus]|uniref:phosphonoacetaldehyde reductase n=1 Tax=Bacillus ndiopicus TaxID=1347368 RepID=UPI0005A6C0BB|nr:phosphonoacetaldehyde reductase [Bacillus ndiopicus]
MRNEFYNPVKIEFGHNSLDFLPRYINGRKALLVTSKSFVNRGIVKEIVSNNPTIMQVISNIQPNPTINQILEIRSQLDYENFEMIIALGGGSVIDAAKAIAPMDSSNNLLELLNKGIPREMDIKPIVAIPTTAGTGSEVTMWGTIWDDINKKKYSIMDERLYCEVAILDPVLHLTLPYDITVQTGLDALSHSLESIWNKNNNAISTLYAKRAISEIFETLPLLANDLGNILYREKMLLASYYAGIAFSNTQTAIAHAMSYYLTLEKGIPHGIAASITLPIIMDVFLKDATDENIFGMSNTNSVEILKRLFSDLNISLNLKDYNLTVKDIDNIQSSLESNNRAQNSNLDTRKVLIMLREYLQ